MNNDLGRNDKCHCGSGEKYKSCCLREDEKVRRLKKNHKDREEEIVKYFSEIAKEVNTTHSDSDYYTPERIQLAAIFTWIETLSNYWDLYQFYPDDVENFTPKDRCEEWVEEFLLTEENYIYASNGELATIKPDDLYELRNGIIHFMGMGNTSEEISIVIIPNDISSDNRERISKEIQERLHGEVCHKKPDELHSAVQDGAELMVERMLETIEDIKSGSREAMLEHMLGIKAIHDKFEREGADKVNTEDPQGNSG
jgi:hypothetical protein